MARFMSLLFILKSEGDSSVNTCSAQELVEQPQAVLCQNRHRGGVPLLFWEMSAWAQHNELIKEIIEIISGSFSPFLSPK